MRGFIYKKRSGYIISLAMMIAALVVATTLTISSALIAKSAKSNKASFCAISARTAAYSAYESIRYGTTLTKNGLYSSATCTPGSFLVPGATATCEAPGLTTSLQNLGSDCTMAVQIDSKTSSSSISVNAIGQCNRGACVGAGGAVVTINAVINPAGCTPNSCIAGVGTPNGCGGLCGP